MSDNHRVDIGVDQRDPAMEFAESYTKLRSFLLVPDPSTARIVTEKSGKKVEITWNKLAVNDEDFELILNLKYTNSGSKARVQIFADQLRLDVYSLIQETNERIRLSGIWDGAEAEGDYLDFVETATRFLEYLEEAAASTPRTTSDQEAEKDYTNLFHAKTNAEKIKKLFLKKEYIDGGGNWCVGHNILRSAFFVMKELHFLKPGPNITRAKILAKYYGVTLRKDGGSGDYGEKMFLESKNPGKTSMVEDLILYFTQELHGNKK